MSNIPEFIKSVLDQVTTPGLMAGTPTFRVLSAFRKKLVEKNSHRMPSGRSLCLYPEQIDEIASAPPLEISCALSEEDIDYLAERLFQTFYCLQDSYAEHGFHDPVAAAIRAMSKVVLKF